MWRTFLDELNQHREWFGWSVGLIAVGLAWAVWVGQVNTLTCARNEDRRGACTLTRVSVWGQEAIEFPVGELLGADVEVSETSDSTGYRLRLLLERGPLPAATSFDTLTGSGGHAAKAEQINAFTADRSAQSLTVQDNTWLRQGLFGLILTLAGVVLLALLMREALKAALRRRRTADGGRRKRT